MLMVLNSEGFRNLLHIVWNLENDQKSNIWYKTLGMTQMQKHGMKLMFGQKTCYQLATTQLLFRQYLAIIQPLYSNNQAIISSCYLNNIQLLSSYIQILYSYNLATIQLYIIYSYNIANNFFSEIATLRSYSVSRNFFCIDLIIQNSTRKTTCPKVLKTLPL